MIVANVRASSRKWSICALTAALAANVMTTPTGTRSVNVAMANCSRRGLATEAWLLSSLSAAQTTTGPARRHRQIPARECGNCRRRRKGGKEDGGEKVERTPAWPDLARWMGEWVEANYRPEPKKRRRPNSFEGKEGVLREKGSR